MMYKTTTIHSTKRGKFKIRKRKAHRHIGGGDEVGIEMRARQAELASAGLGQRNIRGTDLSALEARAIQTVAAKAEPLGRIIRTIAFGIAAVPYIALVFILVVIFFPLLLIQVCNFHHLTTTLTCRRCGSFTGAFRGSCV